MNCAGARKAPRNGFEVHRTWHQMGGRSTCTMLYGHIETNEHRVDHLRQLRELQDETGGFTGFIPFAFEPESTALSHIPRATAFEQLRNLAVSRIYLDNIDHLTAYWVSMGLPLAQVALAYGVDDLHGTIYAGKNFPHGGCRQPEEQTVEALRHAIRAAGREPVQRDSFYNHLPPAKRSVPKGRARGGRRTGLRLMWPPRLRVPRLRQVSQRPASDPRLERLRCTSIIHRRFAGNSRRVNSRSRSSRASNICATRSTRWSISVAIASDGPVYSVILAHCGPVEQLREVVVDPASQTSVNLLRCLLGERGMNGRVCLPRGHPRGTRSSFDWRSGHPISAAVKGDVISFSTWARSGRRRRASHSFTPSG